MGSIILREIRDSDFEDIARLASDSRVREFIGGVQTREESRKGLDILLPHVHAHWAPRAICLENDPRFIGYCGLQPLKKKDKTRFEIEGPIFSEELQKDEILFSLQMGKAKQIQKAHA